MLVAPYLAEKKLDHARRDPISALDDLELNDSLITQKSQTINSLREVASSRTFFFGLFHGLTTMTQGIFGF